MSDQLQELLQRVYDEGVNKAKTEAEQILAQARDEAAAMVGKARDEAEQILKEAKKRAEDITHNTDADLKIAAQHTMSVVKQNLTEVFLAEAFDGKLREAASDPSFVQKLILEIVAAWKENAGSIVISKSLEDKIGSEFVSSLKATAGKDLKIQFSPLLKNGFSIVPAEGSYKLSFTDEDFSNLFKSYLRPRTNKILFSQ